MYLQMSYREISRKWTNANSRWDFKLYSKHLEPSSQMAWVKSNSKFELLMQSCKISNSGFKFSFIDFTSSWLHHCWEVVAGIWNLVMVPVIAHLVFVYEGHN